MKSEAKWWVKFTLAMLLLAVLIGLTFACGGCASSPSVSVRGKGVYTNVDTGTVGAGYFKVSTTPKGEESAYVEYSEDTALLSPTTKTHYIEASLNGSNAVSHVGTVVTAICNAYISYRTNVVTSASASVAK